MLTTKTLLASHALPVIQQIQQQQPLVHCITNDVVQNFTANILLAIGATPAMVIAEEEVSAFVTIADSLLINLGTVTHDSAKSMLSAAAQAHQTHTPWVLDPVAVSTVLSFRSELATQLLAYKPTVIRGNASEILALNGENCSAKGPDSQDSTKSALNAANQLSLRHNTIVAITGDIDYVTDGNHVYCITGGDIALTKVTGTGCSLSAMVAAFIAKTTDSLLATAAACYMMKTAGELATKQYGLGSYAVALIDQLSIFTTTHQ